MRNHRPTLDYVRRRTAEGKSKPEIIRCLKRFVSAKSSGISVGRSSQPNQRRSPLDLYRSINVFIERLWRSLKYECVYLRAFETGSELRAGLTWWIGYYNSRRPHSTLAGRSPDDAYWAPEKERLAA